MTDEIAILEKQLDEFELLLTGGLRLSDKRLVDRVEHLRGQLKSRCLKGELSEELVKRPLDQLLPLLNMMNNVSYSKFLFIFCIMHAQPNDLQTSEKVRIINAQAGLVERRLEVGYL